MDATNQQSCTDCTSTFFRPWEMETSKTCYKPSQDEIAACCASNLQDSGYDSEHEAKKSSSLKGSNKKHLNPKAVEMMEIWYLENFNHPYPSDRFVQQVVECGGITVAQVKKWMANKRVRSNNTLTFNGTVHPKRLQRLHKEQQISSRSPKRQHPYCSTPSKFLPAEHVYTGFPWNVNTLPLLAAWTTMSSLSPM